jgi:hypothetical protein
MNDYETTMKPLVYERTATTVSTTHPRLTKSMLRCGVAGPALFVAVSLLEGAFRPGYSAWHHFTSQLALGAGGWRQVANFVVCGLCVLCFAMGLRWTLSGGKGGVSIPVTFGAFGVSLILAGVFVTDPGLGYPPGITTTQSTTHGEAHNMAGLIMFASLAAAAFLMAKRLTGRPGWTAWPLYSRLTGLLVFAFFVTSIVLATMEESGSLSNAPVGLTQRVAIVGGWGWISLTAHRRLKLGRW